MIDMGTSRQHVREETNNAAQHHLAERLPDHEDASRTSVSPRYANAASTVRGPKSCWPGSSDAAAAHARSNSWAGASRDRVVGAQHPDARSKLGAPKRDHVFSYVGSNHLTMLRRSVVKNPLNKVISVLVAGNVNQRNAGAVAASLANSIKISTQELGTTNLETLLHNLGGKLVGAILGGVPDDVVDGPTAVRGGAVFANVLNAPVAKLAMGHNVDIGEDFFDAGTLADTC